MTTAQQARGRRLIIGLALALPLATIAALFVERLANSDTLPPAPIWSALIGGLPIVLMRTQIALPALWLAWGTRRLVVRSSCSAQYLLSATFNPALVSGLQLELDTYDYSYAVVLFWSEAIVLALMAALMRLAGFRLQRFTPDELDAETLPVRPLAARDYHFSLRVIFTWTTIIALLCAALRVALKVPWSGMLGLDDPFDTDVWGDPLTYLVQAIESVIPLAIGWALLTSRRLAPRIFLALVASVGTAADEYVFNGGPDWDNLPMIALFDAVLLATLSVFARQATVFCGEPFTWNQADDRLPSQRNFCAS